MKKLICLLSAIYLVGSINVVFAEITVKEGVEKVYVETTEVKTEFTIDGVNGEIAMLNYRIENYETAVADMEGKIMELEAKKAAAIALDK